MKELSDSWCLMYLLEELFMWWDPCLCLPSRLLEGLLVWHQLGSVLSSTSSMATSPKGVMTVKPTLRLNHHTNKTAKPCHKGLDPLWRPRQWKQGGLTVSQLQTCKSVVSIIKVKSGVFLSVPTSDVPHPRLRTPIPAHSDVLLSSCAFKCSGSICSSE